MYRAMNMLGELPQEIKENVISDYNRTYIKCIYVLLQNNKWKYV